MRTGKILTAAALFASVSMSFVIMAHAEKITVPDSGLRAEADGLDIGGSVESCYEDIERLHAEGVRLFDTAGLLNKEEKDAVEKRLDEAADRVGFDIAIVTAADISGYESTEEFSDDIFYYSDMGAGEEMSGVLLVMETYGDGSSHITTSGEAIRYITDAGIDYIYDEAGGEGGVWGAFMSGDFYNACMLYAEGVELLYDEGIAANQYNIDENGQTDYYYPENAHRRKGISILELIISAAAGIGAGLLTTVSVKRSYAMKNTAAAKGGINKAYLTVSGFSPASDVNAAFVNRIVTQTPIKPVRHDNDSGHGGGASHTHIGGGGHSFGGGGRGSR